MSHQSSLPIAGVGSRASAKHAVVARLARWSPRARHYLTLAGELADFVTWQSRTFGSLPRFIRRRESLWEAMHAQLDPSRPLLVIELGVAWGYTTDYWLSILGSRADVAWHGFDRFTGLPRAWRDAEEGHFSADGNPPAIDDPRVTWHVGDVEDRLPEFDLSSYAGHQKIVLFDLDLFEPSLLAWQLIAPHLSTGDLLYFDEAFDRDERLVLNDYVLASTLSFEPLGATGVALALRVA